MKGPEVVGLEQLHFLVPPSPEADVIAVGVMMADLGLVGEFGLDTVVVESDRGLVGAPPAAFPLVDDFPPADEPTAEDMLEHEEDIDIRLPTFWSWVSGC